MKNATYLFRLSTIVRGLVILSLLLALELFANAKEFYFITFNAPGAGSNAYQGTIATGINPGGEISGYYLDANFLAHGFLRNADGTFITFDAPHASQDGYGTYANGLNSEGDTVGYYTNSTFNFGGYLRRPDGTFEIFRDPMACTTGDPKGCEGTGFGAINDLGVIAGGYIDKNLVQHALLKGPDGKVIPYDAPGAGNNPGNPANISPLGDHLYQGTNLAGISPGLNASGAITSGYLDENNVYHGYLRSPDGSFTEFDAPGAGTGLAQGTIPISLNDSGVITGFYVDSNDVFHGFTRGSDGSLTTFEAPDADTTPGSFNGTLPESINQFGAITGYYVNAQDVARGFALASDGSIITFAAPGAGLGAGQGTIPQSNNEFGVIAGYYVDANSVIHGFLAIPCGEWCEGTNTN